MRAPDSVIEALHQALRRLARRPGLTAAVVLILGLGIGISTAVFSVVRRVLLRPIPVAELDRLVVAWEKDPSQVGSLIEVSYPYFLDWRAQSRSFEDLAAYGSVNWSSELKAPPRRETVASAAVSVSFFDTLRARPLLGRTFQPEEDDPASDRVLMLSYALWQRRFAGDPTVVGTKVTRGDQPFTIVGVMPREFDFPQGAQLWLPVGPELDATGRQYGSNPLGFRGLGVLYVVGRLKDGVSLETARTDLADITRRLSIADGFSIKGLGAQMIPLVDHYLGANTRKALEALAAASGFVLILAFANVAVLLLVQAIARRTDLAVRRALGASATRVALHQLGESVLLAFGGGMSGALLAHGIVKAVVAFGPPEMPGLLDVSVDGRALGFVILTTATAAVLVALAPAWLTSRLAIAPTLKSGRGGGPDRRGWSLGRLLVTAEVALSIVLLVGSGLMVRSLGKLLQIKLGFDPDHALSFSVGLLGEKYPTIVENRAFYRALTERLEALPGVEAAGAVSLRPLELGPIGMDGWVFAEGPPLDLQSMKVRSVSVNWEVATPDYFRAAGTRLIEGRTFAEHDTEEVPKVAIVSQSLARRCWPGQSAVGKRLHTYGAKSEFKDGVFINVEWQTVVGVVEDARYRGIQNPRPDVYLAYGQVAPEGVQYLIVRTTGDPLALVGAVREQVRAIDGEAEVADVTTMARLVERALAPWRFASALLVGFAFAALALTASGLFAVLHQFVSGRTREIAIRMAVGAEPRQVRGFILSQGLRVAMLGLTLGIALSLALARSLSALLYEVAEHDPSSYFCAVALIGLVATMACLLPARRAERVDPTVALRSE